MQQLQYIVIGDPDNPSFTFEGDEILGTSGDLSVDMIGAELCTDVMEAEVAYDDEDGTLRALPWATPVYFYHGEHLEGKLYSVSVTRIGRKAYHIRTTSAAGIMEYDTFYGGMYSGDTFKNVVECIIKSNGLQPYDGVYRHYFRRKDSSPNPIKGFGITYSGTAIGLATMSSKLSAKIKILGFSSQSYNDYVASGGSPGTSWRCDLLGCIAESGSSPDIVKKHQYGLCMYVSRANTSSPFPAFGNVVFVYGQTTISLGTPSSADAAVFEIYVDPVAGTATINGVTHSISFDNSVANDRCGLNAYGGGAYIYKDDWGELLANFQFHHCELEFFHYNVQNQSGQLQADFVAVQNNITGNVDAFDNISHMTYTDLNNSEILSVDLEPYDAFTYGEYPLFNNRTSFQADVLSRLSYADGIDVLPINGWIPICTKRQALQQILFATGVILIKDEDGAILFTAPSSQSVMDIDDDDIYDEGSEDQPDHVNTVELTEHAYLLNTASELETIYENSASSPNENYIAVFPNAPATQVWSSRMTLTCLYANCNAAIVSGLGILTGRHYAHTEKELRREIASFPDGHAASVSDATLVTILNSETVLDRLETYYSAASKTHVDISINGERCGLKYDLTNSFGETFSGFLVRASKVITSIVRATCEFICGYTPPSIWGGYANYVILTGSGTWSVPASVFEKETPRIHVVLIGGGQGGDGGFAGANGETPEIGGSASPAEGGANGDSGTGGKIYEVTISDPAASYAYSCGLGGIGGGISTSHSANNPGSAGGNTIFSGGGQNYSSAYGASSDTGIYNSITGDRYAAQMIDSWRPDTLNNHGGDGGYCTAESWGSSYHLAQSCWWYIMNMIQLGWWEGRKGADHNVDGWLNARGGGGGGAGCGQDGSDGSDASFDGLIYISGNGGKGGDATAVPPKATDFNPAYYGYGGLGGGGGGGGGAGGWVTDNFPSVAGTGGAGGYGGRGGDGGDGCVLIYY